MRLTLHVDYALRMLIYLAVRGTRPSTVNDVAQSYGISRNHLLKVALRLKEAGLIATSRGRSGGIRLAVAPERINVGRIVRQFGDNVAPVVECMRPDGRGCILSPSCRLKAVAREALGAYLAVFDKYTLADLVTNRAEVIYLLDGAAKSCDSRGEAA